MPKLDGGDFILVDALDGTKEFLARRDCFTVNIALIRAGAPVAGVVYAPARGELFVAGRRARACSVAPGAALPPPSLTGAICAAGPCRSAAPSPSPAARIAMRRPTSSSRSLPIGEVISTGSSLKFCLLAAGEADVYPRFGRTMEWDIAAGDAVLRRAGRLVLDPRGAPMAYGKAADKFANGPFIAWGDPKAAKIFKTPAPARAER